MTLAQHIKLILLMFLLMMGATIYAYCTMDNGYTLSQITEKNRFIDKQLAAYKHPHKLSQTAALAEVWGLTAEDVAKPVDLFADGHQF